MKTLKEFDYDLWTTEDGTVKKYWVRVKATNEKMEVSHEVMKYLRSEEKKMRRDFEATAANGSSLYLSFNSDDDTGEEWLLDQHDIHDEVLTNICEEELMQILTPYQRDIYRTCLVGDMSVREYARIHSLNHKSVLEAVAAIRKKYIKIFSDTPPNDKKMSVDE